MKTVSGILLFALALVAAQAKGETVVLKNGQRLVGAVTVRGDMVYVRDEMGRTQSVNRALVQGMEHSQTSAAPMRGDGRARRPSSWEARIEAKLDERMTVHFENTPIQDVVAFLRAQTGLNIVLAREVPPDTTVTLSMTDMTLRNILYWIAQNAQLGVMSKNEALLIAPREMILAEQTVEVLDVHDQMLSLIDRPRRPNILGEQPQGAYADQLGFGGGGAAQGGIQRDSRGRDLADVELQERGKQFVKSLIHITGPDSWAPNPVYIVPHLPKDSN